KAIELPDGLRQLARLRQIVCGLVDRQSTLRAIENLAGLCEALGSLQAGLARKLELQLFANGSIESVGMLVKPLERKLLGFPSGFLRPLPRFFKCARAALKIAHRRRRICRLRRAA